MPVVIGKHFLKEFYHMLTKDILLGYKWSPLNALCPLNGFQHITNTPVPCIPKHTSITSKL